MNTKEVISELVEKKKDKFLNASKKIWAAAELGMKEFESVKALTDVLSNEGFEIETGLAGIPTAFSASFGSGKPIIGFLGEYDALPNLSQQAGVAEQKPIVKGESGHGCGHNLLGTGSLAAAVALKDYIQMNKREGTVIYYGCPGEEFGCGKAFMSRAGCFDKLDCAFTWHPSSATTVWSPSSLANISVFYSFKGKTAHAAAAPHIGRSALDAAELMNVGVNFLREHVIPEARIHYAFIDVGGQAANVVQDRAKLHYYIRAPRQDQAREIFARVNKVAEGAAMMTETESLIQIKDGLSDYLPNHVLSQILGDAMVELGGIPFDEQDRKLADEFMKTLTPEEHQGGLQQIAAFGGAELIEENAEKSLFDGVIPYRKNDFVLAGSTDVGDVSYVIPVAQAVAATGCIGTTAHTWQQTAQSNCSYSDKAILYMGKALALAGVKVLDDPSIVEKAKAEHKKTTGGKKYQALFPDDVMPTLD